MAKKMAKSVLGGGVGWNGCKAQLAASMNELKMQLKTNGPSIPVAKRLKYEKALLGMQIASALVNKITCAPPNMSFDLSYTADARRSTRAAKRRKR